MITRVLPDANVLYSRTLRDWLFLLRNETTSGMFTLHTTEDIVCEVGYRFRRKRPEVDGRLLHALVGSLRTNADSIIDEYPDDPTYSGRDRDDRHVHAAAVSGEIDIVLTDDLGMLATDDDRYEISTPDDFLVLVDDSMPRVVQAVAARQARYWHGRPNPRPLDEALVRAGCTRFAKRVTSHLAQTQTLLTHESTSPLAPPPLDPTAAR